jgi:hypothetical protein
MAVNDLITQVLTAIKGDAEAIKKISEALVSRDPARIQQTIKLVAKVDITDDEAQEIVTHLGADTQQALAYIT